MGAKQLRTVGIIALAAATIVTLGIIQGTVLQYDVIATSTSSPDPATAIVIVAVLALLFCAGVISVVALIVRGKAKQRK